LFSLISRIACCVPHSFFALFNRSFSDLAGAAAQLLEKSLEQVANLCMALAQKVPDSITQQDILVAMKLIGFSNHQLILACKGVAQ
jgi:hypothetical protein